MPELTIDEREALLQKRIDEIQVKQKEIENEKAAMLRGASGANMHTHVYGNRSDSIEQRCLSSFGKSSFHQLLEVNVAHPRFTHVPYELKSCIISMKENVDINRYIAQLIYDGPKDKSKGDIETNSEVKAALHTRFAKEELIPMIKAFSSGSASDGGAWIPTAISNVYIDEFELEKKVPSLFREIRMATNPFKLPVKTSHTVAKIAGESATFTADSFSVGTIDFDAKKFAEYFPLPEELNEDSAPDILRVAREELTESQIRAQIEVMLNGDDTATHMDFDTNAGAAYLAQKARKGLRKLALANSANGSVVTFSSAVTTAKLDEMRIAAGKFGISVRDCAYIFSPTVYGQALGLSEVSSYDKVGNNATLITGALAYFRGIPIVIAEQVRENVAATGVNTTGGPNTKGVLYLVNKRRFFVGMRRPIRVRVQMDLPDQDRWMLSSATRWDFRGHAQSATEQSTILGIDVTV